MSSPQLEKGYTKISNELLEKIISSKLTYAQESIIFAIIRYSYGFNKTSTELSISFLSKATGNKERNISYALSELIKRHIVIIKGKSTNNTNVLSLNKNYDEWQLPSATDCICNTVQGATHCIPPLQQSADTLCNTVQTINKNYKENYKENLYMSKFVSFWNNYPKKQNKSASEKVFMKIKPNDELFNTILSALENQKQSENWKKENGKYIPMPSTWLNGRRWEDEINNNYNQSKTNNYNSVMNDLKEWVNNGK